MEVPAVFAGFGDGTVPAARGNESIEALPELTEDKGAAVRGGKETVAVDKVLSLTGPGSRRHPALQKLSPDIRRR